MIDFNISNTLAAIALHGVNIPIEQFKWNYDILS